MLKKLDKPWVWVLGLALLGIGAAVYVFKCRTCHSTSASEKTWPDPKVANNDATTLIKLVRYGSGEEVRAWLKAHGPETTETTILLLDNSNDRGGRVRLETLSAIYSLYFDGMAGENAQKWAATLRKMAHQVLRPGEIQSEFIAKSYKMEGREIPDVREISEKRLPASN